MPDEKTLDLIARVITWCEGTPTDEIPQASKWVHYRDSAQQCWEDLEGLS